MELDDDTDLRQVVCGAGLAEEVAQNMPVTATYDLLRVESERLILAKLVGHVAGVTWGRHDRLNRRKV